jgi:hypothetical protein
MGLSASFYPEKILAILATDAGLPFSVFGFFWFTAWDGQPQNCGRTFLPYRMNASAESLQPALCQLLANNFSRYARQDTAIHRQIQTRGIRKFYVAPCTQQLRTSRVKECVQRFFKKFCLRKKIAAMPFQAAEVRASMPTSRKKSSCTTQCSKALRRLCRVF